MTIELAVFVTHRAYFGKCMYMLHQPGFKPFRYGGQVPLGFMDDSDTVWYMVLLGGGRTEGPTVNILCNWQAVCMYVCVRVCVCLCACVCGCTGL